MSSKITHPVPDELVFEGLRKYVVTVKTHMGGHQVVFRFPNGYGGSVVRHIGSYGNAAGLFEMAVVRFNGDDDEHWHLTYDTPITNDVVGRLTPPEVARLLLDIKVLPAVTA